MAIQNPYVQNYSPNGVFNPSTTTAVPQSYVNINAQTPIPNYTQQFGTIFARYVTNEQDALSNLPVPNTGSSFGIDGENMVLYAKFADGHMEIYDLIQREPPKPIEPLTADSLSQLLDRKFSDFEDALSKKFVLRRDNFTKGGSSNG